MQFPVPVPPVRRFISAADEVTSRSGISVNTEYRRGHFLWAAVRTVGEHVVGTRSGSVVTESVNGSQHGLLKAIYDAVRQLQSGTSLDVFCQSEDRAESLRLFGLEVSALYPPAPAVLGLQEVITSQVEELFATVEIATDASRSRRSRWVGHGWVLVFPGGTKPALGHKAMDGGSVLEGELRAFRLGLLAAREIYVGALDGHSAVTVSSDSRLALRMINEPGFEPPSADARCVSEVLRIRGIVRCTNVDFRWVKGHADNLPNIFADRLAVLSRRCQEAGLSDEETYQLTAGVREEARNQLVGSPLALAA
ncbi:ribonuclease HI [Arthrobacter sp. Marseille-P9274]|uniref:ribonuclease HI n=1 Tax=Arthrobacter sp. Marseille-P9274 TaxID=2866572 RepID=UPI0021C5F5FC|nr:ribonuclease H family protein [Arthrobacter sp. Marseille-P9274]